MYYDAFFLSLSVAARPPALIEMLSMHACGRTLLMDGIALSPSLDSLSLHYSSIHDPLFTAVLNRIWVLKDREPHTKVFN